MCCHNVAQALCCSSCITPAVELTGTIQPGCPPLRHGCPSLASMPQLYVWLFRHCTVKCSQQQPHPHAAAVRTCDSNS